MYLPPGATFACMFGATLNLGRQPRPAYGAA